MSLLDNSYKIRLWKDAEISRLEPPTVAFWHYLLTKHWFFEPEWAVNPEQHVEKGSMRRVDIQIIRMIDIGPQVKMYPVCVVEFKNASVRNPTVVEDQAIDACGRLLRDGAPACYAMTCLGTSARCWIIYHSSPSVLVPLFGSNSRNNFGDYIAANSNDAYQIDNAVKQMKNKPPIPILEVPSSAVLSSQSSSSQWYQQMSQSSTMEIEESGDPTESEENDVEEDDDSEDDDNEDDDNEDDDNEDDDNEDDDDENWVWDPQEERYKMRHNGKLLWGPKRGS